MIDTAAIRDNARSITTTDFPPGMRRARVHDLVRQSLALCDELDQTEADRKYWQARAERAERLAEHFERHFRAAMKENPQ